MPQLRIVEDALWQRVKARQEQLAFKVGRDESGNALNRTHRTTYLLSDLMLCGSCGAPYVAQGQSRGTIGRGYYSGRSLRLAFLLNVMQQP